LVPLELPCDGAQMLQIPMPKTRPFLRSGGGGSATTDNITHYYLELRTNKGMDGNATAITTSVQVRVSQDTKARNERAVHTWILDMIPSTTNFDGMLANTTFTDPAGGVTFAVGELDTSHAVVTVTMDANNGGPLCLGGAAFTAPGPGIESCNATPAMIGGAVGGTSGSTGGAPGTGGRGTGGAAGIGGRGTGGAGATGGRGTGGAVGTGGRGTGGAGAGGAGTGGAATGGTGIVATGGAVGTGGTPSGTGGVGVIGTGGDPGAGTGGSGNPIIGSDVTGGCACGIDGNSSSLGGGALTLIALMFLGGARRRRRRG
jgi:MYXO-CTERM domain-containing protein